jgi:hypothetical protein
MSGRTLTLAVVAVLWMFGVAAAAPHPYPGALTPTLIAPVNWPGYAHHVTIPGSHVVPDVLGLAHIGVFDDVLIPVEAYYCQDLNANGICGEPVNALNNTVHDLRTEPIQWFCQLGIIHSPLDPTPRNISNWQANNWDPALPIEVFLVVPTGISACGQLSVPTTGVVSHF